MRAFIKSASYGFIIIVEALLISSSVANVGATFRKVAAWPSSERILRSRPTHGHPMFISASEQLEPCVLSHVHNVGYVFVPTCQNYSLIVD